MVGDLAVFYSQLRSMQDPRHLREVSEGRHFAPPRIFKAHRQRTRYFPAEKPRRDRLLRILGEEMTEKPDPGFRSSEGLLDRKTLCLPDFTNDSILHSGDHGFTNILDQYFPTTESNASERLVNLKSRLCKASTHEFWKILMEDMCEITGAQCGLVAKRMLVDDQNSAVELPALGEVGSCLMGVAFYTACGDNKDLKRDYRYTAFGTPCAYMKYDKVFIVPEKLSEITPNNPNVMPWGKSEAFIGVPLMMEGKCFAHFALIWSEDGARRKRLSWSFVEMFMHSLEDLILQRISEGRGFAKEASLPGESPTNIIPLSAIAASQSLKPYARSLSHELRTPMQGVIGMTDIMYTTVLEAIANEPNERIRSVFRELKNNIEYVQDSSHRAVEAADNVVHAYDLNMQMPEAPLTPDENDGKKYFSGMADEILRSDSHTQVARKSHRSPRKRNRPRDPDFRLKAPFKRRNIMSEQGFLRPPFDIEPTAILDTGIVDRSTLASSLSGIDMLSESIKYERNISPASQPASSGPTKKRIVTRDFMKSLISEVLKSNHPASERHFPTELGEMIEIQTEGSRGAIHRQMVNLVVEPDVPETIATEQQHLEFSISKVIDNAIKFTDEGNITITVKLNTNLEIWVADTGCGMTEESRSRLFQPHFQQNATISRSKDGLGLSLFNAKAHVRKNLGGDVTLERSATSGPSKGSDFLISLPISMSDKKRSITPVIGALSPKPHPHLSPISLPPPGASISSYLATPTKASRPRREIHNSNLAAEYPLNFLVAEDNAINRKFISTALHKLGYGAENITLAFDGTDAVRFYAESLSKPVKDRYNIILMDIWMPTMDGYEATKEILNLAKGSEGEMATIIAVTADITDDCSMRSREAGMRGFLAKPYKVFDIEKVILEHCGGRL